MDPKKVTTGGKMLYLSWMFRLLRSPAEAWVDVLSLVATGTNNARESNFSYT